jgi:hypothetical protein
MSAPGVARSVAGLGSARVMTLLFSALGIQKALLCVGAVLVAAGYVLNHLALLPIAQVLVALGLGLAVVPLVFAGGLMLRYFIASRRMQLIPRAREQVLGGMALTVATIATAVTLVFWSFGFPPERLWIVWLRVGVTTSLLLLSNFILVTSVPGMMLWFLALGAFSQALVFTAVRERLVALADSGWMMTAILAGSWLGYAAWFLGARSFKSPDETPLRERRRVKVQASSAAAIRAFLFGNPSLRYQFSGGFVGTLIVGGSWTVVAVATQTVHSIADAIAKFAGPAFTLGVYAGMGGFLIARRSKFLWLRGGADRNELFRLCERQAWRFFGATAASLVALLAIAWVSKPEHGPTDLVMLLYQMSMGACLLYLGLMHVSGWRVFDVVCTIVLTLCWVMTFPVLANVMERLWVLPELFGGMAAFAFILRLVAVNRWARIDWLVCKPPKVTPRGLSAAS